MRGRSYVQWFIVQVAASTGADLILSKESRMFFQLSHMGVQGPQGLGHAQLSSQARIRE